MPKYHPKVDFERGGKVAFDFTKSGLVPLFKSYGSNEQSMLALSVFWVSLLGDSPIDSNKPLPLVRDFAKSLALRGPELIRHFASLYDALTRSVYRSDSGDLVIEEFIVGFKDTPIFREYLSFYQTHSASTFKYISSFLLFGKKVYFEDDEFDAAAFRDWCQTEQRLTGVVIDEVIASDLKQIITWMLRHFDDTLFLPKHGSGAVSEPNVRAFPAKNALLYDDAVTDSLFARPFVIGPTVPSTCQSKQGEVRKFSRLQFVPKDIGKSRSICMEPAQYQWMQQGVRLWLEDCLDKDFPREIPLHNQSVNQRQAQFGSRTGKVDTIDLSQASDSVHIDLVKKIFPAHVLQYLLATRSEGVEIMPDIVVPVTKFAPMGSALCFPVQSIIYAAIVLRSSLAWRFGKTAEEEVCTDSRLMYHYYKLAYEDPGRHKLHPFSIYGDDIICDQRITPVVIETLIQLGFVVNENKSFVGPSAFRESCGGYYLLGEDVTPLRAKLGLIENTIPISTLSSIVDLGNRAYESGYLTLYRSCIQYALHYPITGVRYRADQLKNEILFTADRDVPLAFHYSEVRNKHLRERIYSESAPRRSTCFRYQRNETRSLYIRPTRSELASSGDDAYAHCVWWRTRLAGPTDSEFSRKIPTHVGPSWRWTATEV